MLSKLYKLLTGTEQRSLLRLLPWIIGSALVEIAGVAAVIPFLSLLASPESIGTVPLIGAWLAELNVPPLVLLRWAGIAVAGALLLVNIMIILTNWRLLRFAWGLNHTISSRLLRHYLAQSYTFLLTRNSAELASKITQEVQRITQDGLVAALDFVAKSVVTMAIVTFLVLLDPLLAFYTFVSLTGVYGLIFLTTRRFLRRIGREATRLNATRLQIVNEAMGGFKEIKVAGREAATLDRYLAPSKRFSEVQAISRALSTLPRYALEAIAIGGMVLIASLLAGRSESFSSTLPLLGAYAFAGLRLMPAMQSIFNAITRMRFTLGALESVEGDFAQAIERETELRTAEVQPMSFSERLDLRSITYHYPSSTKPALAAVNLTIPKRGNVALVGRTGSGKTTLADVILGLLPPDEGYIEVDGVQVNSDNLLTYRRLFGYVPQNIFLSDGTILQNVAFGIADENIDSEAVQRACDAAQISEFITSELPASYQTVVGERGIRLSGGQRQRIGIARALYSNPQILIFDEATSALDVHTEQAVYRALEAIAETRTVITIAHRLETVANADHVVVMEHGRVQNQGVAADVLERYKHGVAARA